MVRKTSKPPSARRGCCRSGDVSGCWRNTSTAHQHRCCQQGFDPEHIAPGLVASAVAQQIRELAREHDAGAHTQSGNADREPATIRRDDSGGDCGGRDPDARTAQTGDEQGRGESERVWRNRGQQQARGGQHQPGAEYLEQADAPGDPGNGESPEKVRQHVHGAEQPGNGVRAIQLVIANGRQ